MLNRAHHESSPTEVAWRPADWFRSKFGILLSAVLLVVGSSALTLGGDAEDLPEEGSGALFRAGHIEGQGVPQVLPITPLELFPYIISDEQLFFSDLRFFPTNDGTFGGNAGFGYRMYNNEWDRLFGISGWYDADYTRQLYFQQLGLSLETYAEFLDARANFYLPVGQTEQQYFLGALSGTAQFQGENVVYDQLRKWYAAMKGFDMEAGIPLPGEFAQEHALRLYGGGYHFVDNDGNSITGGSARLQANIVSGLDAWVQVMNDSFFNTRAFVGVAWTFGPIHRSKLDQSTAWGRMGEHVTRNYTVLAPSFSQVEHRAAINPSTGAPYRFAHVSSAAAAGGDGTVGNPFQTIAQAQAAARDIVFVQSGSVLNGTDASVVLSPGQRIFGAGNGINHILNVPELGTLYLPRGPGSGARPILNGAPGDSVVLASHSEFAGFSILNAGGNGVVGNGVQHVTLRSLYIDQAAASGIRLVNSGGSIGIGDTFISNAVGDALFVDGGSANIGFSGRIAGGTGRRVIVANTAGGSVDLSGLRFEGSGGQGIQLQNAVSDVLFQDVNLQGVAGPGIEISGGSGQFRFGGTTTVSHSTGPAVAISGLGSSGGVTFRDLTIEHRQDRGVAIDNSAGSVTLTGTARIRNALGSTGSALSITNSSGSFSFNRLDVTDATGDPGVNLQSNTGTTHFETLNVSSHSGTALFASNAGTLSINPTKSDNSVDLTKGGSLEATDGTALDISNTKLAVNLTKVSSSNAANGVRLVDTTGALAVYGTGAVGSGGTITGATTGIFLKNAGDTAFQWMTIDGNGTGIRADNVSLLIVENSFIRGSTTYGIDALNLTRLSLNSSTLSGNGAANMRALFDQQRSYSYSIYATDMTSGAAENVVLTAQGGAAGSSMNLFAEGNLFENTLTGTSGLKIDWHGTLAATLNQNAFATSGGSNTGIMLSNTSTGGATSFVLTNSHFESTSDGDTFVRLQAAGPAQTTLTGNQVRLEGLNGTAFRMTLAGNSSVNISGNSIADHADGGTGILFDSITGPGNVLIEGNVISFADEGGLLDRGIIFSTVTNTITLQGTSNNIVSGADTPFFVPASSTNGGIFVNGVRVP
ncbi:MAG: inverse autotransporter beta domain-containing protein [Planctomycetaceae bacterium]